MDGDPGPAGLRAEDRRHDSRMRRRVRFAAEPARVLIGQ
jgi:hypothetical protein